MLQPIVATKLHIPPPRPDRVIRPRLLERLQAGLHRRLTLVSAPAGFGKTTLVSEWLAQTGRPAAWLSLHPADRDPGRLLRYLVAALQAIAPAVADAMTGLMQAQPPPLETLLTALINAIAGLPVECILVLDDYHLLDAPEIDQAMTFVLEHLPRQLHLVIISREDPPLPLARLRARNQLTELRAADLRFTPEEATIFLNQVMGLNLAPDAVAALEARTEGWIAGLHLAALSMQGQMDSAGFIEAFTGSHQFVLDYLLAEVLHQQPASVQDFLLRTAILERFCGPLCDAVLGNPAASSQATLEYLARANLFLVPLDRERRWYRYHHLFAELLRRRLYQLPSAAAELPTLHRRASEWYESKDLEIEAFQHAAAANDLPRAIRLIEGQGIPLHFRGAVAPILDWLETLPRAVLDVHPVLWITYASALLFVGRNAAVDAKLAAAEASLQGNPLDAQSRDLLGQIASMRATMAVVSHDITTITIQSQRALDYLQPDNWPIRMAAIWALGFAQQAQGERAAARRAYTEVLEQSSRLGDSIYTIAALTSLGQIQEADNQLPQAAENYRRALALAGDPPQGGACEACLGLARITYQWNDLAAARAYAEQSWQLLQQIDSVDTAVSYRLLQAQLCRIQGDLPGAEQALDAAETLLQQRQFRFRLPAIAALRVQTLLEQGRAVTAEQLARRYELPAGLARVHLAQGEAAAALAVLEAWRRRIEARAWPDQQLQAWLLQALAHAQQGDIDRAMQTMAEALALAMPGGFVRIFLDEGPAMGRLLETAHQRGIEPVSCRRVLEAFPPSGATRRPVAPPGGGSDLVEPLSEREREVLQLLAAGLSNQAIADRLYLSLHTAKVHVRNIFAKLEVKNRTQAVSRGRALGLLPAD